MSTPRSTSTASCVACRRLASDAARRRRRARGVVKSLGVLVATLSPVASQICTTVRDNSWQGLTDAIDSSHGFAILCPFHISNQRCPPENKSYDVKLADLYVMCDSVSQTGQQATDCVIDCPGTHFKVHPNAGLTVDGLTLMGSTKSAIQVKSNGSLTSYNTVFSSNAKISGNGGAINAADGSDLSLMYSRFENNQALNGGAVYHLGPAVITGSTFVDNVATNGGGGAIFSGANAVTELSDNMFASNRATFFAPALFDGSDASTYQEGNSGCNNAIGDSDVRCDGIYSIQDGVGSCETFEDECISPTAAPTTPIPSDVPSSSPSMRPSASPTRSQSPSASPSRRPSLRPSVAPSRNPTFVPSAAPTGKPSTQPTQSSIPSSLPTLSPSMTLSPSQSPSVAPTHKIPTQSPSQVPSSGPSAEPSTSTTPTTEPTIVPSSQPSVEPSTTPTAVPSDQPSVSPTESPTSTPTELDSEMPSSSPTTLPSDVPSESPTEIPTELESNMPSSSPTPAPTKVASAAPTLNPTSVPTDAPSTPPSHSPTVVASSMPSSSPTFEPTDKPSASPSRVPVSISNDMPSVSPSESSTPNPTPLPTAPAPGRYSYTMTVPRRRRGGH